MGGREHHHYDQIARHTTTSSYRAACADLQAFISMPSTQLLQSHLHGSMLARFWMILAASWKQPTGPSKARQAPHPHQPPVALAGSCYHPKIPACPAFPLRMPGRKSNGTLASGLDPAAPWLTHPALPTKPCCTTLKTPCRSSISPCQQA